uniref:Uncharacterized protein n=1 Tax=Sipha flava TaxID=143950 RepID=A0A2S2RAT4_9HEMI
MRRDTMSRKRRGTVERRTVEVRMVERRTGKSCTATGKTRRRRRAERTSKRTGTERRRPLGNRKLGSTVGTARSCTVGAAADAAASTVGKRLKNETKLQYDEVWSVVKKFRSLPEEFDDIENGAIDGISRYE